MAELYLVRHGRATAAWNEDDDPGLDDTGRLQARTVANALKRRRPMGIVSSPLARARETAIPLSEAWGCPVKIEERVGEIPSPVKGLKERGIWLGHVMTKKWPDLPRDLQIWREGVIEALLSFDRDTVVFSHFIAINAAVGKATGDERVVSFRPCNGSISLVRTKSGRLQFIRLGSQGETEVL
ncbi:MAG: histidine phosphatase family protein [Proteobacteria bacterium]|jgi:broad specificity phosphatase PhoE|nr:histidine phosphatase family protein [Desulfobacterales bacterium]MBL7101798.1 histidine phosphatase family protein [Desulfobacteraceae bacterium]MBU0733823.1 histidine phosphatase family protein [Pseudomonadota bacterium]MBL7172403.1 histidine phosphatase family protein [Desulfobacteraceae bacterium]MBU0990790.1 histidine phosphatase family protein [Pseudomonadota bacterium]